MNFKMGMLMVSLAVASVIIAPSLIIDQSAEASKKWCESQKGKSHDWILGCKQGWWDHNHCQEYNPKSGEYAKGYSAGWNKGKC